MTDRELLELAAKASAVDISEWHEYADAFLIRGKGVRTPAWWNPLTDDGDALRLAVKLDFQIRHVHFKAHAGWPDTMWKSAPHGDDKLVATRRAIVRAAAEIGGSM